MGPNCRGLKAGTRWPPVLAFPVHPLAVAAGGRAQRPVWLDVVREGRVPAEVWEICEQTAGPYKPWDTFILYSKYMESHSKIF